jgi:acyl carrier protein
MPEPDNKRIHRGAQRLNHVHERLEEIARKVFADDSLLLTDSTRAADVPGWDSLAHVNFVYSVEEEFGVQLSDDEFVGFEDIGDLKRIISAKTAL